MLLIQPLNVALRDIFLTKRLVVKAGIGFNLLFDLDCDRVGSSHL